MGKNNRQRRAAKKRSRSGARPPTPGRPSGVSDPPADAGPSAQEQHSYARELIGGLLDLAAPPRSHPRLDAVIERALLTADPTGRTSVDVVEHQLTLMLVGTVAALWEDGWQPLDLVHVLRKQDADLIELLAATVTEHARASTAHRHAPAPWLAQLQAVADDARASGFARRPPGADPLSTGQWRCVGAQTRRGARPLDAWRDGLRLLARIDRLPGLQRLVPRPSEWSATASRARTPAGAESKVFSRIRGLLAKAEATSYAAEAETYTAKAQELMTRHAVDAALMQATHDAPVEVAGRRVHLQSPYASTKVDLLTAVGRANRARVIYLPDLAIATIVGTPPDLDAVEVLFVSLLIQATRAMVEAGSGRPGGYDRSPTYRRSFLAAYAARIGERLTDADRAATASYGAELVPVLVRQTAAVDDEFDRLFPHTTAGKMTSFNQRGWSAGRAAADRAVLAAGRLSS